MKTMKTVFMCACLAMAAGSAAAADEMKKDDGMAKDGTMKMTMQECKDHMAMSKSSDTKKDEAMMKKDAVCEDMMRQNTVAKPPNKQ